MKELGIKIREKIKQSWSQGRNRSRSLTLLYLFLLSAFSSSVCAQSNGDLIVSIASRSGDAQTFTLSWNAVIGQQYNVFASESLNDDWIRLNTSPITASAELVEFNDPLPLEHRFYQVIALANTPSEAPKGEILYGSLTPSRAQLKVGQEIQFSAIFPSAGTAQWTLQSTDTVNGGSITPQGLYTAPASLPDPGLILIHARNTDEPDQQATALVAILTDEEFEITREQATDILLKNVIASLPNKESTIALGLHEPLEEGDRLSPFDPNPNGTAVRPIESACWFFMVDHDPVSNWAHPVDYVLVNCQTGAIELTKRHLWYPELNGQPFWNSLDDKESKQDQVHIGTQVYENLDFFPEVPAAEVEASPNALAKLSTPGLVRLADEFLPINRVFPPAPSACKCETPGRFYAIIGVMSPEESRLGRSARRWKEVFESNRYITKSITNADGNRVLREIDQLRSVIRPCDVLVVMLLGHGVGGSVSRVSSASLAERMALIPSSGKYFIMETCDAGHVFDVMKSQRRQPVMKILTASNKADPTSTIQITGTAPLSTIHPFGLSAFSSALLSCMSRHDDLSAIHLCLTSATEIGPLGLRMKLADPLFRQVGVPDGDQDGVTDEFEIATGLDPNNPDTDGDGVCDGIEFGELATLEEFDAGGFRNFLVAEGIKKPIMMTPATLPLAVAQNGYDLVLSIRNGIPINDRPVNEANPFGRSPVNGFKIQSGAFPAGLQFDDQTGSISGRPSEFGDFTFKIRFTDAIGAFTEREFNLTVAARGEIDPLIEVTTVLDGNVRDDDLSLREAVMLANGDLKLSDLRPDPDPNNRVSEGELRWVRFGAPSAESSDRIEFQSSNQTYTVVQGPIEIKGNNDSIQFWPSDTFTITEGPLFKITGNNNIFDNAVKLFTANTGSVVIIEGNGNVIGGASAHTQTPSYSMTGSADADVVLIEGNNNRIAGTVLQKGKTGIHIKGGSNNLILRCRLITNQDGIRIDEGAKENEVTDCTSGFLFENREPPTPFPNSRHGIVIAGGAQNNRVILNGVGGNGGTGILLTGVNTRNNECLRNRVGTKQGNFSRAGEIGPNQEHGYKIEAQASNNQIRGGEITENVGHGLLITGVGTSGNIIGEERSEGIEIDKPDSSGDAVRIEGGASDNTISVNVKHSGANGISLIGSGTSRNRVQSRPVNGFYFPTQIDSVTDIGILIAEGASENVIDGARVRGGSVGIEIRDRNSDRNRLRGVSVSKNRGDGIRLVDDCQHNRIEAESSIEDNGAHGLVISGVRTSFNLVKESNFNGFTPNKRHAIRIDGAANNNRIESSDVQRHEAGGILITGAAESNQIVECTVRGGLLPDDVAKSTIGITIEGGATRNQILKSSITNNGTYGLLIEGPTTTRNYVYDNNFLSNVMAAIRIENAKDNRIGSATRGGNDIQRGPGNGIHLTGSDASENRIRNNIIGATFSTFFLNGGHGVIVDNGAHNNRIGGARPRFPDPATPQTLLPPIEAERVNGNLITGNGGNGIHIDNAHNNFILGNLIGFANPGRPVMGNEGHGIAIVNGAKDNCIGNCVSKTKLNPGYTNQIVNNAGSGIWISGSGTTGNTIRRNEIDANTGGHITLDQGANGGIESPGVFINVVAFRIEGSTPNRGYIELFSDAVGFNGIYHLTAWVGGGDFTIDQANPADSFNALIIESARPIRFGDQYISYSEDRSGNTSEYTHLDLTRP
ncbi:MAG: hypothetical protein HOI66_16545 [Verrucomicrobia bacterium]|nr:hypothetical protein [Verrucomicrobiota bacterium]